MSSNSLSGQLVSVTLIKQKYAAEFYWVMALVITLITGLVDDALNNEIGLFAAYLLPIILPIVTYLRERRYPSISLLRWFWLSVLTVAGIWVVWWLGLGEWLNNDSTGGSGMAMLFFFPVTAVVVFLCWVASAIKVISLAPKRKLLIAIGFMLWFWVIAYSVLNFLGNF